MSQELMIKFYQEEFSLKTFQLPNTTKTNFFPNNLIVYLILKKIFNLARKSREV